MLKATGEGAGLTSFERGKLYLTAEGVSVTPSSPHPFPPGAFNAAESGSAFEAICLE